MNSQIRTIDLHKTYKLNGVAVEAVRGIDLTIRQGEFLSIMGPSGCGKSTVLHLIAGLTRPTSGEIYIEDMPIHNQNETQLAIMRRQHVGFVFQFFNLVNNLPVAQNVELPALLIGRSKRETKQACECLLAQLDIADKATALPAQLSGGQQQRVAIARALINKPTILLADEPTGNLDSRAGLDILYLLKKFHEQGQTIVLVTHDATIASFANRVLFLRDGLLVDELIFKDDHHDPALITSKLTLL